MKQHNRFNRSNFVPSRFALVFAFLFVGMNLCGSVRADGPDKDAPLPWVEPFSALSGPNAKDTLVVMLFTNDSPFPTKKVPTPSDALWCLPMFESVYRKTLVDRADLKDRVLLQKQAVGTPSLISGGQPQNQPARAVLAICDTNYRLLSLMIGVPDKDNFVTLIEDAEQVAAILKSQNQSEKQRVTAVSDYTKEKLSRIWRKSLEEMIYTIVSGEDDEGASVDTSGSDKELTSRIGRIGETFESIYLSDVKLRFALSDASDQLRLTILEHHPQARRPWCNAMLPFIAGEDFNKIWRTTVELVWKTTPVVNTPNGSDLARWWDSENAHKTIVLAIEPPILARMQRWPPINVGDVAAKRGVGWTDLQDAVVQKAYRSVDAQDLAVLFRDRKLTPIDIRNPSRARYVVFEAKQSKGLPIRESDLPAKYIGRIKRMK